VDLDSVDLVGSHEILLEVMCSVKSWGELFQIVGAFEYVSVLSNEQETLKVIGVVVANMKIAG
jgi:hypothetical protein